MKRLAVLFFILALLIPSVSFGVKISDLPALTTVASGDILAIVDISETAVVDKTKKITWVSLMAAPGTIGGTTPGLAFFDNVTVGAAGSDPGDLTLHDGGIITIFDDGNDFPVTLSVINGTTKLRLLGHLDVSASVIVGSSLLPDSSSGADFGSTFYEWADMFMADNDEFHYGSDQDIRVGYDEVSDDRLEWSDGSNLLMSLTDVGSVGNLGITGSLTVGSFTRRIIIRANPNLSHPTTKPDDEIIGTYHALGFDDDTDTALITFEVPTDWDGASDFILKTYYAFAGNLDDGETYKIDISYRARTINEDLDTGTATTGSFTESIDTGAGEGTVGRLFRSNITLSYLDGNNPLTAEDVVGISIDRDDSGDSDTDGEILIVQFEIEYTSTSMSAY